MSNMETKKHPSHSSTYGNYIIVISIAFFIFWCFGMYSQEVESISFIEKNLPIFFITFFLAIIFVMPLSSMTTRCPQCKKFLRQKWSGFSSKKEFICKKCQIKWTTDVEVGIG